MASPLLDFKKFKHIQSDDKSTILQHQDGHKLTLMHNALSKDNQAQLKAMQSMPKEKESIKEEPKHNKAAHPQSREDKGHGKIEAKPYSQGGEVQKYAEGDDDISKITAGEGGPEQKSSQPPVNININAQPGQQPQVSQDQQSQAPSQPPQPSQPPVPAPAPAPMAPGQTQNQSMSPEPGQNMSQPPQSDKMQQASAPVETPNSSQPIDDGSQEANAAQAATSVPKEPQTFDEHKQNAKNEISTEFNSFITDDANGHIKPKTMHDLLWKNPDGSDKGLLGKIGTVFGLLLSGAGSGLTHQPDVLMSMLQKQIDNDIEAQSRSASNAQNLFKINQQNFLNQNLATLQKKQGNLTDAQTQLAKVDANAKAFPMTRMMYNIKSFHKMAEIAQTYPPGSPKRIEADKQLAMLYPMIQQENLNIEDKAAAASALINSGGDTGDNREALIRSGQEPIVRFREERQIPGTTGVAKQPIEGKDRDKFEATRMLDNRARDLLNFATKHKGTLSPDQLTTARQKAEELIKYYSPTIDNNGNTKSRLDWLKEQIATNPTSWYKQLLGSNAGLREIIESNRVNQGSLLDHYNLKLDPHYKGNLNSSSQNSSSEIKTMNGIKYQKTNGGWQKVK